MSVSSRDVESGYDHATDHHSVTLEKSTFREYLTRCYERLATVAREGETITYAELAADLGVDEELLKPLLDAVAYIEYRADRPPLPVLVVKDRTGKPAVEFFDTVERLGLRENYRAHTDDELLAMMATNVYGAWQR